jgi:predicted aminopeptidase
MPKYFLVAALLLLAGCAELPYYAQSLGGHMEIMRKTRPIEQWLADPATDERLAARLRLVLELRRFAAEALALPVGDSYADYADIGRPWVVKNLFAAPEFSLELETWCHPFAGCIAYRGYFDEAKLETHAARLRARGMDVHVAGIAAYSTLGWFDDPALNTFIHWSDSGLAGLLFHELAHRRLYVDDDSAFNEAYATALQQAGVETWLERRGRTGELQRYRQRLQNRRQVMALIRSARDDLRMIYQSKAPPAERRARKQARLARLQRDYRRLASGFRVPDGFSRWMEQGLNNAKLLSVATYHDATPGFLALLQRLDGDFAAFHRAAERLAGLPAAARKDCLEALASGDAARCAGLEGAE